MLYKDMLAMIGDTPLLEADRYCNEMGIKAKIYTKLEMFNPAGSVKDRVAFYLLKEALKAGKINKESTIVEATSGNTGIGIASVCQAMGLKAIIVMPESMSEERKTLIRAYGAKLELTDRKLGMQGAVDFANELVERLPNAFLAGQFTNLSNPLAHYETTAKEMDRDLHGKIDILVAGIGTGGTITGIGRYFKEKDPHIKVIGVEPANSPLLSQHYTGLHGIQGIGANFVPPILDLSVIDEMAVVSEKEAYQTCHDFVHSEGLLIGISSGAALSVAKAYGLKEENKAKNIVVILPDGGERYLSTALFKE